MRKFLTLLIAVLALGILGASAQSTEDQYVRIYGLIQDGDRLVAEGRAGEALIRYRDALGYLQGLQRGNPGWNEKIVKFRLNYLSQRIEALQAKTTLPSPTVIEGKAPGPVVPSTGTVGQTGAAISELERQVGALRDQVRQLEGDKTALELKLKEALAVQPAAMDPRELAKAESRIQALQKENELLKVTLEQGKTKPFSATDAAALAVAKQALDEANARLASQTARADKLEEEQKALQSKLGKLTPSTWNAAEIEKTQKELATATNQIKEQKEFITRLAAEREALQTRLKTGNAEAEAASALRLENELLKKQLADLKAGGASRSPGGDVALQSSEARTQIAALQSEKQVLQLEKIALENRVKQLTVSSNGVPVVASLPPAYQPEESSRIKQLEKERRDLENQLAAARKQLASRRSKTTPASSPGIGEAGFEPASQAAGLRSRPRPLHPRGIGFVHPPVLRNQRLRARPALSQDAPGRNLGAGGGGSTPACRPSV